jgi:spore germination protein GerM
MNIKRVAGIVLLVLLFFAGGTGGYLYFSKVISRDRSASEGMSESSAKTEDLFLLRLYYPSGNQLQLEERSHLRVTGQTAIAIATVEEYLKGPAAGAASNMQKDVKLLGVYRGADKVLYVDLSDEFRRKFQGDALAEIFLMKGLYESIISNVEDVQDVKVLIEGKEVETLGGHFYLLYPLKEMVAYEYR